MQPIKIQETTEKIEEEGIKAEIQELTPEEIAFTQRVYQNFQEDYTLKNTSQTELGGRTLKQFWDNSNKDYNVLVDDYGPEDPVVPYASTISRDKSNAFISRLSSQLIYPSVVAQNKDQEIDHILAKVCRAMLEWAHDNDGKPDESGHQKNVRYIHKAVVEGTVHVDDSIIDKRLFSSLVDNEEIYIPNFRQPSIQLQPHLFRVKDNITYKEAERIFGDFPNWKYVEKGNFAQWVSDDLKWVNSLVEKDKVQIIYYWEDVPRKDLKRGVKRAKLFNVFINGVLMFKADNLSPYKDGLYPISKGIFESFSDPNYYWGNSMPNKAAHDKKWLDGWKTLIRHKAKLAAIPPTMTFNGFFLDSDMYIPGETTMAPNGMKPEDIITIPGISDGVSNSDLAVMQDAKNDINEGNLSPQASGGQSNRNQTAREAVIREQNEQEILGAFGQQIAFLVESRTYPILMRLFQFNSKSRINKIAVADQDLGQGITGTFEMIFEKPAEMTKDEIRSDSFERFKNFKNSINEGRPKMSVQINPEYLNELDLYIKCIADPQPKKTSALRRAEAMEKFGVYGARPELFNQKSAAKKLVKEMGDDPSDMIIEQQPNLNPQQAQPGGKLTNSLNRVAGQETASLGDLNM